VAQADIAAETGMREALRRAREAEAVHREAVMAVRDSKSLRLQVLKGDVDVAVAGSPEAQRNFDVAISPSDPPKLWIDAISFVEMEPDYRTFRLVQDTHAGRETIAETTDRAAMLEHVKLLMAHRMISRERQIAGTAPAARPAAIYSSGAIVLAWLAGVALGALALLALVISLKII
jgi:hypothetical protein